jgi:predicted ArsR family transcriptional regulator
MDSVPPIRRNAYELVTRHQDIGTGHVAIGLGLPTTTARRALEDLAAHRLIERHKHGQVDRWTAT